MTRKNVSDSQTGVSPGIICILVLIAICALTGIAAAETYTAADQNANGQYNVVLTVNPDGSNLFKAAGVAYGTMDSPDPPSDNQQITQDVHMTGQYGYAIVAAADSSGNQADAETWLYNGEACVDQVAGISQPGTASGQYSGPSPSSVTKACASQTVSSSNFSSIIADTDSETLDGSTAEVTAQATSSSLLPEASSNIVQSNGGSPTFFVCQHATASSPVLTGVLVPFQALPKNCNIEASADQSGTILCADTASAETFATEPNGLSSRVGVSVNGNDDAQASLIFLCMQSSAISPSGFTTTGFGSPTSQNEVESETRLPITAFGASGSTIATSSGPNGQYSTVTSQFTRNVTKKPSIISISLDASGAIGPDDINTCAKSTLLSLKPFGYDGSLTAANSVNTTQIKTFNPAKTKYANGDTFVNMNTDGSFKSSKLTTKLIP